MADYRYGDRDRGRNSIFSDEGDRWRGEPGRARDDGRGPDERGFFDRAGDEVRSWFGDEEAERRREMDARRTEMEQREARGYGGGRDAPARYGRAGYGQGGQSSGYGGYRFGSAGQIVGSSPHDESYRRWREQQIEALDREYEEYCRHRQQQFESEFSTFRQTRESGVTQGGTGGAGGAMFGQAGQAGSPETASQTGAATAGPGTGSTEISGTDKPRGRAR